MEMTMSLGLKIWFNNHHYPVIGLTLLSSDQTQNKQQKPKCVLLRYWCATEDLTSVMRWRMPGGVSIYTEAAGDHTRPSPSSGLISSWDRRSEQYVHFECAPVHPRT